MFFWKTARVEWIACKEIEVLGPAMAETKRYGRATVQDEFGGDALEFVP